MFEIPHEIRLYQMEKRIHRAEEARGQESTPHGFQLGRTPFRKISLPEAG
jgi:hypothetical protein